MTISVVLAASKGGQGRTTTAITLGHLLAQKGKRVLIVDVDAQGNLSEYLGIDPTDGLYRLLVRREPLSDVILSSGRPGLDIVPGDYTTAEIPPALLGRAGFDTRLKRALKGSGYDWVLIDTAPSLSPLHILAFMAAEWMLTPAELAHGGGLGVAQVLRVMASLKQDTDSTLRLAGILPTKWDRRLAESATQLKALVQHYPKRVWMPIPVDVKAIEAPAFGKTLLEHSPGCPALKGRWLNDQHVGGYEQALARLEAVVKT
jgi:chromosome partitioning protein